MPEKKDKKCLYTCSNDESGARIEFSHDFPGLLLDELFNVLASLNPKRGKTEYFSDTDEIYLIPVYTDIGDFELDLTNQGSPALRSTREHNKIDSIEELLRKSHAFEKVDNFTVQK